MSKPVEIKGVKELLQTLKFMDKRYGGNVEVIVGYTASYAIYVHENLEMKLKGRPRRSGSRKGRYWDPQGVGRSKFLEHAYRMNVGEIKGIIKDALKSGANLEQALTMGGLRLQRESQLMVPVDTGNLKNSAFTRRSR